MPPRKLAHDTLTSEPIDGAGILPKPSPADLAGGHHPPVHMPVINRPYVVTVELSSLITALNAITDPNLAALRLEVLKLALAKVKGML